MALATTIVWEVRSSGSDNNGGGFKTGASGTDRSQQDAAFASGTNMTVDVTQNTKVTPDGYTVVAADIGNVVQIRAGTGWTVGFYEITAAAGGEWTLDRSPAAVGISGGTWSMGGALATPTKAINSAMVGQNLVWIKNATYSVTAALSPPAGSNGLLSRISGYNTTRGDLDGSTDFTNHPTIQSNNVAIIVVYLVNSSSSVSNLSITTTGATKGTDGIFLGQEHTSARNCKVTGTSSSGISSSGANNSAVRRCFVTALASGAARGFYGGSVAVRFIECVAADNPCNGFEFGATVTAIRCISDSNTGAASNGFYATSAPMLLECVSYNNGQHGLNCATSGKSAVILNSIFVSNAGYGINSADAMDSAALIDRNAFYNNTSGLRNNFQAGPNDVTLTGDPFVDAPNQNFALNNTTGAGASARNAGFPGTYSGIPTTGYADIGAVRHQDPVAGGGPLIDGGLVLT